MARVEMIPAPSERRPNRPCQEAPRRQTLQLRHRLLFHLLNYLSPTASYPSNSTSPLSHKLSTLTFSFLSTTPTITFSTDVASRSDGCHSRSRLVCSLRAFAIIFNAITSPFWRITCAGHNYVCFFLMKQNYQSRCSYFFKSLQHLQHPVSSSLPSSSTRLTALLSILLLPDAEPPPASPPPSPPPPPLSLEATLKVKTSKDFAKRRRNSRRRR